MPGPTFITPHWQIAGSSLCVLCVLCGHATTNRVISLFLNIVPVALALCDDCRMHLEERASDIQQLDCVTSPADPARP